MSKDKTDLLLCLSMTEHTNTYDGQVRGRFEASVYAYDATAGTDTQPAKYLWAHDEPLAGFKMTARYGNLDLNDGRGWDMEYGFEPGGALVRQWEAERYAKVLSKTTRAYDRLCQEYGRPASLGHEVVYLMKVLGITRACYKRRSSGDEDTRPDYWCMRGSAEEIQYYIDRTIDSGRARQREAAQAA